MLTNPYYMGVVEYAGKRVLGRHTRLVGPDTFEQVQAILIAQRCAGDRSHKHAHYLHGMLFCAECGGRLLFGRHRGRNGHTYDYFSCANRAVRRRHRRCSTGHYRVVEVERRVAALFPAMHVSPAEAAAIRRDVTDELAERQAVIHKEEAKHRRRIERIEANQAKLVQLYYRDLVSDDVLEREQSRLKEEKAAAQRLLDVARIEAEEVEGALDETLARATQPEVAYASGNDLERRVIASSFFERIEIGPDGDIPDPALTAEYDALRAWCPRLGKSAVDGSSSAEFQPSSNLVHRKLLLIGRLWRAPMPLCQRIIAFSSPFAGRPKRGRLRERRRRVGSRSSCRRRSARGYRHPGVSLCAGTSPRIGSQ
jgi:hypothetical protein